MRYSPSQSRSRPAYAPKRPLMWGRVPLPLPDSLMAILCRPTSACKATAQTPKKPPCLQHEERHTALGAALPLERCCKPLYFQRLEIGRKLVRRNTISQDSEPQLQVYSQVTGHRYHATFASGCKHNGRLLTLLQQRSWACNVSLQSYTGWALHKLDGLMGLGLNMGFISI